MPRLAHLIRYVVLYAVLDVFPVSLYGRTLGERLRNLWGSLRASTSALLNVATLTILVITVTVVGGLYSGSLRWLRQYVEDNQMARTVELSSTFGVRVAVFRPEDLAQVRALEVPGVEDAVEAVHGWNDVTFWFYSADGSKDETLTHGRTVDPADPMLGELAFVPGGEPPEGPVFEDQGIAQAVVSVPLLNSLGYPRSAPFPDEIYLDYDTTRAPVRVVGVCEETPAGDFLITERFNRTLLDRRWQPNPRFPGVYLGPIEDEAAAQLALGQLADYLAGPRVAARGQVVRRAGTEKWFLFERRGAAWTSRQWEEIFLPVARRRLGAAAGAGRHEFVEPLAPERARREELPSTYTRASVYVRELPAVPAVADALGAAGYRVTSNSRELALLFLQISSLGQGILTAVILVVGSLTAVSLFLSFSQTIQRKTPEIAILKAFGTGNVLVLAVYVLQAVLLWGLAFALGGLVVSRVAALVDGRLLQLLELRGYLDLAGAQGSSLVEVSGGILAAVAAGSLTLCCLATLLAGLVAVHLQPARALNLQR